MNNNSLWLPLVTVVSAELPESCRLPDSYSQYHIRDDRGHRASFTLSHESGFGIIAYGKPVRSAQITRKNS